MCCRHYHSTSYIRLDILCIPLKHGKIQHCIFTIAYFIDKYSLECNVNKSEVVQYMYVYLICGFYSVCFILKVTQILNLTSRLDVLDRYIRVGCNDHWSLMMHWISEVINALFGVVVATYPIHYTFILLISYLNVVSLT